MNIEGVIDVYEKFNSGNSKDFFEAEKLKSEIILHKKNIWMLMPNIFNPEFDPPLQLFITCLVNDISKLNFKTLPLYEIMELLHQTLIDANSEEKRLNENVVNLICDLIGMLKFYIYVIDERFCFNFEIFEEEHQYLELSSFFKYINSPPQFIIDTLEEKDSINLFINNELNSLILFLFQQIEDLSDKAIQIFNQCTIMLLNQEVKKSEFNPRFNDFFINSLNDSLKRINSNLDKFSISDIIDLLSTVLNFLNLNDKITNQDIFSSTFSILIEIISNSELSFKEEKSVNSFYNLMLNFPCVKKILDNCENYCSSFFEFIEQNLQENYFISIRILSASTDFLYNVYDYVQPIPAANMKYSSLFMTFVNKTLESIEKDPVLTFNNLFEEIDELKATKKIIISLLQASENKIDESIKSIIDIFNAIRKDDLKLSLVYDVKISFIIYLSAIIIKYDFFESGEEQSDQNLTDFLFEDFIQSYQRLDDYKNNEEISQLYASERMVIEFLRIYIKKYIFNNNTKELCPIIAISSFSSYNSEIDFIFSRLWKDIKIDLQLKQAGGVMSLLLDSKNVIEILTTADCYQDFYDNFTIFPTKFIVYHTISIVTIAKNCQKEFLQKVFDSFEELNEVSILKCLKLLASFFSNATTENVWTEMYETFQTKIESITETISNINENKIQKILLKFLAVFMQSVQNIKTKYIQTDEAESTIESSYMLLIIQLLLNLGNNILNSITSSEIENSDFDQERWSTIELLIQSLYFFIQLNQSSEKYNQEIHQSFALLVNIITNVSFSSFLSHPLIVTNLSNLLKIFVQYYKDQLQQEDQFWDFFITATKLILINSNSTESINIISQSLCTLLDDYSILLRNHFVLIFDILAKKDDLFLAVEFLILFFKNDEKFVFEVGKLVEDDLDDDDIKHDFNQYYLKIWQYITDNENKINRHEIIHHIYRIIQRIQIKWHTLPCLEKCFVV